MVTLFIVTAFAFFANDNAEFIKSVEHYRSEGYEFVYTGKQDADPNIPHIAADGKVYFSMRKE